MRKKGGNRCLFLPPLTEWMCFTEKNWWKGIETGFELTAWWHLFQSPSNVGNKQEKGDWKWIEQKILERTQHLSSIDTSIDMLITSQRSRDLGKFERCALPTSKMPFSKSFPFQSFHLMASSHKPPPPTRKKNMFTKQCVNSMVKKEQFNSAFDYTSRLKSRTWFPPPTHTRTQNCVTKIFQKKFEAKNRVKK